MRSQDRCVCHYFSLIREDMSESSELGSTQGNQVSENISLLTTFVTFHPNLLRFEIAWSLPCFFKISYTWVNQFSERIRYIFLFSVLLENFIQLVQIYKYICHIYLGFPNFLILIFWLLFYE